MQRCKAISWPRGHDLFVFSQILYWHQILHLRVCLNIKYRALSAVAIWHQGIDKFQHLTSTSGTVNPVFLRTLKTLVCSLHNQLHVYDLGLFAENADPNRIDGIRQDIIDGERRYFRFTSFIEHSICCFDTIGQCQVGHAMARSYR